MNLFFSGNPLTRRDDDETIYVASNVLPPISKLSIDFNIDKKDIKTFIENLYFITMEENGYCYFYPSPQESSNLCRFEWHYDFRGKLYFLRIGLFLTVNKSGLKDVSCSIEQHEKYKDYKKEIEDCNITDEELDEIKRFIMSKIEKAKEYITLERSEVFNIICYVKTQRPLENLTYLDNKSILLMPTYSLEGEFITSIVLSIKAFSFMDSKKFADEKINLYCAFFSLAVGYIELNREKNFPLISPISINDKESYLKNIESFYPNCEKELFGFKYLDNKSIYLLNWLYETFDKIEGKNKRKVKNIIFAFRAGKEATKFNRTLSLISFVSNMNSISKIFEPEYFNENGDRKTIVHYLSKRLDIKDNTEEYKHLEKWSKKIYSDHRSSYVHGSNHKFEEYSQNFEGENFLGLPSAIPSQDRVVSKQYEYNNDFDISEKVVKFMIISCLQDLSEVVFKDLEEYMSIDFSVRAINEGFIGMPNRNWARLN